MTLELHRTTSSDPVFGELVRRLDDELSVRYPEIHAAYAVHNVFTCDTVIVARLGELAVGCGCFKPFDAETVELKRMFVDDTRRGQRIGSAIVRGLEAWASELGYRAAVLETGDRQPEAVRLYEACGYSAIPPYGPYAALPNSICMRRRLAV